MLLRRLPRRDWATSRGWSSTSPTSTTRSTPRRARPGRPRTEFAQRDDRAPTSRTPTGSGLGRPDAEPLATETIPEIVALIEALIEGGHAYESGGDVYFRVRSFPGYGKLSNRDPDEMDQGEEAGTESLKEDPLDFALWKARKPDEDTAGPRPWGEGRPGWHIECSAMAEKLLGADFAIHGGGIDLVFPHHENEIAQTEAARGVPLARIWMHNGMVQMAEEKMSKSVGNIFQLSEALDRYGRDAVVAYLISGHYRQPLEFSEEALEEAAAPGRADPQLRARAARGRRGGEDEFVRRPARGLPGRARRRLQHAAGAGGAVRADRRGQPAAARRAPARRSTRCCRCSGSSRCWRRPRRSTRRPSGCWRSARQARAGAGLRAGRPDPRRAGLPGLRGPRHARGPAAGQARGVAGDRRSRGHRLSRRRDRRDRLRAAAGRRGEARPAARSPGLDQRPRCPRRS